MCVLLNHNPPDLNTDNTGILVEYIIKAFYVQ